VITTSEIVAGVDEAGRGPLAGPVVAAAVILRAGHGIVGLADSKKISAGKREYLAGAIREHALAWATGEASVEEIDRLNILQATLLAMQRAVSGLGVSPDMVLIDGNQLPKLSCPAQTVVGGDALVECISAASIIAKVNRDAQLDELDRKYPGYGLSRHKGYPTRQHIAALSELGVSPVHRRSFAPVKRLIETA
jgi:ribonuclease HII